MKIGVPKEIHPGEHRVATTPEVAQQLQKLGFEVALTSQSPRQQELIIDYVVHHRRANGATTPKVFKWMTLSLAPRESWVARRSHAFREITTRSYYAGGHRLEIQINGHILGGADFDLVI